MLAAYCFHQCAYLSLGVLAEQGLDLDLLLPFSPVQFLEFHFEEITAQRFDLQVFK